MSNGSHISEDGYVLRPIKLPFFTGKVCVGLSQGEIVIINLALLHSGSCR
jgi:hypothetical protein